MKTIKKFLSVEGEKPKASELNEGEVILNLADNKAYSLDANNQVVEIMRGIYGEPVYHGDTGDRGDSLAIDINACCSSSAATAVGYHSSISNDSNSSVTIGTEACIGSSSSNSIAVGANASVPSGCPNSIAIGFSSNSQYYSTAIGACSSAGSGSESLGKSASAQGCSISIGNNSNAYERSINIGAGACSSYDSVGVGVSCCSYTDSTAVGIQSNAYNYSEAIGWSAQAQDCSVSMGNDAQARYRSVGIGSGARATECGSVAVGVSSSAAGRGVAVGEASYSEKYCVAIGNCARSTTYEIGSEYIYPSVAIGTNANAKDHSVAIGTNAVNTYPNSVAIGACSRTGSNAVAMGVSANATAASALAIGFLTTAGERSTSVGNVILVTANYATALGYGSEVSANYGTALGHSAHVLGINGTAVGSNAVSSSGNGIAIGYNAYAGINEIRLGANGVPYVGYINNMVLSSDIRDKADIEKVDKALELINAIEPIRYVNNLRGQYEYELEEIPTFEEIAVEVPANEVTVEMLAMDSTLQDKVEKILKDPEADKAQTITVTKRIAKKLTEEELRINEIVKKRKTYPGIIGYDKEAYKKGLKKGNRKHIGVSAQQVEQALIKLYGTDNYANIIYDSLHDTPDSPADMESKKSVNYNGFIPFLIGAVKELTAKIEDLQAKESKLEKTVQELLEKTN